MDSRLNWDDNIERQQYIKRQRYIRKQKAIRRRKILILLSALVIIVGITFLLRFINRENSIFKNPKANAAPETQTQSINYLSEQSDSYDYSKAVPLSEKVDDSYFDDAVFIGDSRTEGLMLYTGLADTTSFAYKGLMVDTIFTSPLVNRDGKKLSVMDALEDTQFNKVYIMLGINETGWVYSDIFIDQYGKVIDAIKEINPDALIYIQLIFPVTDEVSATHEYITNTKIYEYNERIKEMAEEKEAYYLNTAEAFSPYGSSLPDEASTDGIHLKKEYCDKWLEYLKTHIVAK